MKQSIPYIVTSSDGKDTRVVNAISQAQVRVHLTSDLTIRPAKASEVVSLMKAGVEIEDAKAE